MSIGFRLATCYAFPLNLSHSPLQKLSTDPIIFEEKKRQRRAEVKHIRRSRSSFPHQRCQLSLSDVINITEPYILFTFLYSFPKPGERRLVLNPCVGVCYLYYSLIFFSSAYFGQAGFYILNDPACANGLPTGKYDIPLALAAKQYKSNGDLFSPAGEKTSLYGDVVHVNGQPWPYFEVEPRKYRLRFLDTSISRAFSLYFEDDQRIGTKLPFQVVGSDAGLLSRPVITTSLEIAMAERWEVVFDFADIANKSIILRNNREVHRDEDYEGTDRVMRFVVGNSVSDTTNNGPVPESLANLDLPPAKTNVDRTFRFGRRGYIPPMASPHATLTELTSTDPKTATANGPSTA